MDERIKQDITMFLVVLVSCLLFVGAVETFTGLLSQTRERNLANQQIIDSANDMIKQNLNNQKETDLLNESGPLT